jgi:hypothetical protein
MQWFALLGRHFNSIVLPEAYHFSRFKLMTNSIITELVPLMKLKMIETSILTLQTYVDQVDAYKKAEY